ncbi:MAG: hypothetical protein P8Y75_13040 [Nitrospirota bacterium]
MRGARSGKRLARLHTEDKKSILESISGNLAPVASRLEKKAELMPVMSNQLGEVVRQTEEAALGIGKSFSSIAERARDNARRATGALKGIAGQEGEEALLEVSRKALAGVIESLRGTAGTIERPPGLGSTAGGSPWWPTRFGSSRAAPTRRPPGYSTS